MDKILELESKIRKQEEREAKLDLLEKFGVENWCWYDEARYDYEVWFAKNRTLEEYEEEFRNDEEEYNRMRKETKY